MLVTGERSGCCVTYMIRSVNPDAAKNPWVNVTGNGVFLFLKILIAIVKPTTAAIAKRTTLTVNISP
jgi:hypothetical protein